MLPPYPVFDDKADLASVSVKETRNLLKVGDTTIYGLMASGVLESFKIGRARRITLRSIRRLVDEQLERAKWNNLTTGRTQPERPASTSARTATRTSEPVFPK